MPISKKKFNDEQLSSVVFDEKKGAALHEGMVAYTAHFDKVLRAVTHSLEPQDLTVELRAEVQCDTQKSTSTKNDKKSKNTKAAPREHRFNTRPFVEYLFAERSDDFEKLMDALSRSNDSQKVTAFIASLAGTALSDTTALFAWNETMENKLRAGIDAIRKHGHELAKPSAMRKCIKDFETRANAKGAAVLAYADSLEKQLGVFLNTIATPGDPELRKIKILAFKRNVFNKFAKEQAYMQPMPTEKQDASPFVDESASSSSISASTKLTQPRGGFHVHRDPAILRILGDIMVTLLTVGIANLIQGLRTHNSAAHRWTFFQHTTTEVLRLKLQDSFQYKQERVIDMLPGKDAALGARSGAVQSSSATPTLKRK